MPADIALITDQRFEEPRHITPYVANILEEDRLLTDGFAQHGLTTQRIDWSRQGVDWSQYRCAILRTPWDYFERFDEFEPWLRRVSAATLLCNELTTVLWNIDKRYLSDLAATGVPIVPTEFLPLGEIPNLGDVLSARGWQEAVVKPAISGGARHTYRIHSADPQQHQATVAELLRDETMLVQPFIDGIVDRGEVTVVMIDGVFTHAVIKRARPGDFRVQDDFGGTVQHHTPSSTELAVAARAINTCQRRPAYGRVDLVHDERGQPMVMELELIEPELWLRYFPAAAQRLADAVATRL